MTSTPPDQPLDPGTEPGRSEPWIDDLKQHLDDSTALDYVQSSRLAAARARALETVPSSSVDRSLPGTARWLSRHRMTWVPALAVMVAIGTLYVQTSGTTSAPVVQVASQATALANNPVGSLASDDLNLLLAEDSIEFFSSLEFVESLDELDQG